MNTNFYFSYSF